MKRTNKKGKKKTRKRQEKDKKKKCKQTEKENWKKRGKKRKRQEKDKEKKWEEKKDKFLQELIFPILREFSNSVFQILDYWLKRGMKWLNLILMKLISVTLLNWKKIWNPIKSFKRNQNGRFPHFTGFSILMASQSKVIQFLALFVYRRPWHFNYLPVLAGGCFTGE